MRMRKNGGEFCYSKSHYCTEFCERIGAKGDHAVQPRTRDWIVDETERAFIWAGAEDFDEGIATFKKVVDKLQSCYDEIRSKEYFGRQLDAMPEPGRMQKRFLRGVFRFLPQVLLYGAKRLAENATDDIGALPSGRPGPDAYLKAQIVAEIGNKLIRGCSLQQAKQRTAMQFNLKLPTVQRIWDDRGNPDEVDFRSVLRFLSDEGKLLNDRGEHASG